jgi:hypothetical protein
VRDGRATRFSGSRCDDGRAQQARSAKQVTPTRRLHHRSAAVECSRLGGWRRRRDGRCMRSVSASLPGESWSRPPALEAPHGVGWDDLAACSCELRRATGCGPRGRHAVARDVQPSADHSRTSRVNVLRRPVLPDPPSIAPAHEPADRRTRRRSQGRRSPSGQPSRFGSTTRGSGCPTLDRSYVRRRRRASPDIGTEDRHTSSVKHRARRPGDRSTCVAHRHRTAVQLRTAARATRALIQLGRQWKRGPCSRPSSRGRRRRHSSGSNEVGSRYARTRPRRPASAATTDRLRCRGACRAGVMIGHLDLLGVAHSPIIEASVGWIISFHDPDGTELRLYSWAAR